MILKRIALLPVYVLAGLIVLLGFLLHWWLPQILGLDPGWKKK